MRHEFVTRNLERVRVVANVNNIGISSCRLQQWREDQKLINVGEPLQRTWQVATRLPKYHWRGDDAHLVADSSKSIGHEPAKAQHAGLSVRDVVTYKKDFHVVLEDA